jgi:hypothetical protein
MIMLTLGGWRQVAAQQVTHRIATRLVPGRLTTQQLANPSGLPKADETQAAQEVAASQTAETDDDRPVIFVDDRFAGWQAAGTGEKASRLSEELRANWVMVDDNGRLSGQVLGLKTKEEIEQDLQAAREAVAGPEGLYEEVSKRPGCCGGADEKTDKFTGTSVYLLNRGKLLGSAKVDEQNRFEFLGVKPGNYALVGYGQGGFFAFGLNVIPFIEGSEQPNELFIPAIAVSGKPVTEWVTSHAPSVHFRKLGKIRFGQGKDDPARLYGVKGLRTFSPDAEPATSIVAHPTGLTDDGRLLGRIHHVNSIDGRPLDLRTTAIQLMQENKVVQQTGTDNYGVFEFSNVQPGSYDLMAHGPDGVAALQIEVVAEESAKTSPVDLTLISSETIGWLNHFMHEAAYNEAISGPRPRENQCDRCGNNPCRCGHGYGYGYGYGGYGYGGGYGGW